MWSEPLHNCTQLCLIKKMLLMCDTLPLLDLGIKPYNLCFYTTGPIMLVPFGWSPNTDIVLQPLTTLLELVSEMSPVVVFSSTKVSNSTAPAFPILLVERFCSKFCSIFRRFLWWQTHKAGTEAGQKLKAHTTTQYLGRRKISLQISFTPRIKQTARTCFSS